MGRRLARTAAISTGAPHSAVSTPKGVMRVQASVEGFGSEAKFPAAPGVATA